MAEGIGSGGGATMHPGAPVIWPTGKSQAEQIQQAKQAQQAGRATTSVTGTPTTAEATATEAATAAATAAAAAAPTAAPTIARPMTMQDIVSQLLSQGIRPTQENRQLASKMLENGLELSQENFAAIFSLMKGRQGKPMSQEAAILTLTKGLESSPRSVDMLSGFLAGSNQVADQIKKLNQNLSSLAKALESTGKETMKPELQSSLTGIIGSLQEELRRLAESKPQENFQEVMRRSGMIKDSSIMKQLLGALEEQLAQSGALETVEGKELMQAIAEARKGLEGILENMTSQAILSKENVRYDQMQEKYYYWQIPNAMGKDPKTMEILVKGDETQKKNPINPNKTRIIIKLETDDLGEMTIFIDVKENNVWYMFNAENDEVKNFIAKNTVDLKDRMQRINYYTQGVQVIKKKVEIKKYIMPTIDLDDLTRVSTEV